MTDPVRAILIRIARPISVGAISAALALALPTIALAQEKQPEAPKEDPKPQPAEEKPKPAEPLPGLDELLGLPEGEKSDDAPIIDAEQLELERALESRNVSEMFQQAVQQMADAAKLLRESRSAGPTTQRVQQEIITKLEKLIEEAEKQQSQSSSSSSSSQQQQQQQQQQPQQPQPGQSQQPQQGENRDERLPPGGQQARLSGQIDAMAAAWGALPARIRDALLQGAGEKYSSLYESMTEAYYRRLAEQNKEPQ